MKICKLIQMSLFIVSASAMFFSCTNRILDFTIVSSRNVEIAGKRGPRTKGEHCGHWFLGMFLLTEMPNIYEAIDRAIENAGPEYDALEDGSITSLNYYNFFYYKLCYTVEGIPVNTKTQPDNIKESRLLYHSSVLID